MTGKEIGTLETVSINHGAGEAEIELELYGKHYNSRDGNWTAWSTINEQEVNVVGERVEDEIIWRVDSLKYMDSIHNTAAALKQAAHIHRDLIDEQHKVSGAANAIRDDIEEQVSALREQLYQKHAAVLGLNHLLDDAIALHRKHILAAALTVCHEDEDGGKVFAEGAFVLKTRKELSLLLPIQALTWAKKNFRGAVKPETLDKTKFKKAMIHGLIEPPDGVVSLIDRYSLAVYSKKLPAKGLTE